MKKTKSPPLTTEVTDLPELQHMQELSADIRFLTTRVSEQVPVLYKNRAWHKPDLLKICHEWLLLARKFKAPCAGMEKYLARHSERLSALGLSL